MVLLKLKYVDELSGGRKRFRRRFPKAVAEALGAEFFQVPMVAREGGALVTEHALLLKRFEFLVAKEKRKLSTIGGLSPREKWKDALKQAETLIAGVVGAADEMDARDLVADELQRNGSDSMLYRAVATPDAVPPEVTFRDAVEIYRKERMNDAQGRNQKNRLDRVCRRVEDALGSLEGLTLVGLKREHARKLRDDMLNATKQNGEKLAASSVRRELDMVRAIVATAIREFDLQGRARNPFDELDLGKKDGAPESEWEKRDPLPKDVLLAMRKRMKGKLREPALGLIWRLLEGTGCRGAEVVGLRVEDVKVNVEYPHIKVTWHEDRRLKTKVSNRLVPLVGDALEAAKEALERAQGETLLFARYGYEAGPDAVSQALMKHLRKETSNRRHVVYSLRHNMKDLLVAAGVPQRDENRILGHSLGGVGDRFYGGDEAKLKAATDAMRLAHQGLP
ncbi:tyrosine-type recombinase/integrase [Thioclava kandeliae]|uniref:Tyrosine-type recombinase/integrase n=1 Tax=Thioclava kandeliae TaxID=3070818 RepID=A0ABV1SH21_9RHOB